MECPFCHVTFDEIIEIFDDNKHPVAMGCHQCLKERNLLAPNLEEVVAA